MDLRKNWFYAIMFVLFLMGLFYGIKGYACEINPHALKHIRLASIHALKYENCHTFDQKRKFHLENGERCFKDAQEACTWLPRISDRNKARACMTTFGAGVAAQTIKAGGAAAITTLLISYGFAALEEWNYIQNKLYWAEYHFTMAEFYR